MTFGLNRRRVVEATRTWTFSPLLQPTGFQPVVVEYHADFRTTRNVNRDNNSMLSNEAMMRVGKFPDYGRIVGVEGYYRNS